jgi:ABC-type maltose transport system permease subunit
MDNSVSIGNAVIPLNMSATTKKAMSRFILHSKESLLLVFAMVQYIVCIIV